MRQVETIVGMKGGRNEGKNDGRGWIQPWYTVRTFVNVTMYPHYKNTVKKKRGKV
jgi:hypothetical protein